MTNHIWQSTVFGLCAGVLAIAFRGSRAQVRFWLWLSASLKFLVPFSLLLSLGSHLAQAPLATKAVAAPVAAVAMLQISQPFPEGVVAARSEQPERNWIADGLFGIWLCGFVTVTVVRFRRYSRIRAAVHASQVMELSLPVAVREGVVPWPPLPAGQHYCLVGGGARGPNFSMEAQGMSLDEFAAFLSSGPRPVVNKTGIKGAFEFKFEFGLDDAGRQRLTEITGNDPGEPTKPPVFIAIKEQLGLKLESAKGRGEFLVIDHVERPDEN